MATKGYGTATPKNTAGGLQGGDPNRPTLSTSDTAKLAEMFPKTPYVDTVDNYDFEGDENVFDRVAEELHPEKRDGTTAWSPETNLDFKDTDIPNTSALDPNEVPDDTVSPDAAFAAKPDVANTPRKQEPKPDSAIAQPGQGGLANPATTSPKHYKTLGSTLTLGGRGGGAVKLP
jgi:hypothetical protein